MRVEENSYNNHQFIKEAEYIHRFYLPPEFRDVLQPQDLAVIYGEAIAIKKTYDQTARNIRQYFSREMFTIRYKREGLIKEIPETLMNLAVRECLRYFRDIQDSPLSREQFTAVMYFSNILSRLESRIQSKIESIYQEMLIMQEREVYAKWAREGEKLEKMHSFKVSYDVDDACGWSDKLLNLPDFIRGKPETDVVSDSAPPVKRLEEPSPDTGLSSDEAVSYEPPPQEGPTETTVEIVVTYVLSDKNAGFSEGDENIMHRYSESVTMRPGFDFKEVRDSWEAKIKSGHKKTGTYDYLNLNRGWLYSELVHFSETPLEHICSISNIKVEITRGYSYNNKVASIEERYPGVTTLPRCRKEDLFWPSVL